jgi:hypothetical protein
VLQQRAHLDVIFHEQNAVHRLPQCSTVR